MAGHEPGDELVVRDRIGHASLLLEVVTLTPALTDLSKVLAPGVRFESVRIVLRLHRARGRVHENERTRPFRIGRREHCTGLTAGAATDEHRTFGANRVENRTDVVHPRLEASQVARAVRKASSALVEQDQARERRQTLVERLPIPVEPWKYEIRERGDEDEIHRPIADDLIRDRDIAAPRVMDIRHVHDIRA